MKLRYLEEPSLEFAFGGRHIDPRHGLDFYGPADVQDAAVRTIRVGVVGTQESIDGVTGWLDVCRTFIDAKESRLGHLFPPFPGFDTDRAFRSSVVINSRLTRRISTHELNRLSGLSPIEATNVAVDLYDHELRSLNEEPNCDVIIVCRPETLIDTGTRLRRIAVGADIEATGPLAPGLGDFHSLLKARSLTYSRPIQIVRRSTWDPAFKEPKDAEIRRRQDDATKAWNFHTAIYYKAGGAPWRLPRDSSDLASCYVGIGFYRTSDPDVLETSVAQIFNQRGDGVIVRGSQARVSKTDKQPHLSEEGAQQLLYDALETYRNEHHHSPARVVLHKTSPFTPEEAAGFRAAMNEHRIDLLELIWIRQGADLRLFRDGPHPALRGTFLSLDSERHVIYTRGSVPFYKTYPGMYVPRPVGLHLHATESSPVELAAEVLALTKMNWNSTQLDGRHPITIRTADKVGEILRHLGPEERSATRYAYYM